MKRGSDARPVPVPLPGPEARYEDDDPIVCLCNGVRVSAIVEAVEHGADDLSAIFDATWAGCGPCGGSCQADLLALLDVLRDPAQDQQP